MKKTFCRYCEIMKFDNAVWVFRRTFWHFLTFAGAVLLAWLLLAPRDAPAGRVFLWPGQAVSVQYGGVALPVENKALARDVRRLINSLRYDDLQDIYPSLGQWPHRVAELGQSQPLISFQAGDYVLGLFQTQRPQALLAKTDGQGRAVWRDFYRTERTALLQQLLDLAEKIRAQGPAALAD